MTAQEIAYAFVALCAQGRLEDAQAYWSDDVVSIEAFPSPHQISTGREAVLAKQRFWNEGVTMHGVRCEGPFINGDRFAAIFELDCTGRDGVRQTMREIAHYTVANAAIIEERFYPLMAGQAPT